MTIALEGATHGSVEKVPAPFYHPELDVLRFFAFFSVFMFHATYKTTDYFGRGLLPLWANQVVRGISGAGAYGVDLFFVLSAYLITELLLREKEQRGALDVKSFYIRRMLRIWPLYFFFVPLAAFVPFLNPGGIFSLRYVVPFLLLAGNWSTIVFGPTGSVAEPLWSVSVEEQFYLAWPPIVARLSRRQVVIAAVIMILLANLTRLALIMLHSTGWQIWANSLARLDPMAGGILLAVLLRNNAVVLKSLTRLALVACGAGFIVLTGYIVDLSPRITPMGVLVSYPVVAASCTAVVFAFINWSIRSHALEYLGKISYGLYVYHQSCIRITDRILTPQPGALHTLLRPTVSLVIAVLVSAISYGVLEAPFLKLKRKFTHISSRPV